MEGVDQSWEVAQGAHAVSHPDGCPGSTSVSAAACVPRAGVQLGGGGANSAHPPVPPPRRHPGSYSKRPPPGVSLSEEQETAPWHAAGASLQGIQYLEEESEESTSGPLNRLLGEGREGRGPSAVLGPVSPPGRWGRATCLK